MRRLTSGPGKAPKVPKGRVIQIELDEDDVDVLDSICTSLGVDEEEALLRGIALLSAEMAKMALIMPAFMTEDDDEFEED